MEGTIGPVGHDDVAAFEAFTRCNETLRQLDEHPRGCAVEHARTRVPAPLIARDAVQAVPDEVPSAGGPAAVGVLRIDAHDGQGFAAHHRLRVRQQTLRILGIEPDDRIPRQVRVDRRDDLLARREEQGLHLQPTQEVFVVRGGGDARFVDGLVLTGARLQEWASLVVAEVPASATAGHARRDVLELAISPAIANAVGAGACRLTSI